MAVLDFLKKRGSGGNEEMSFIDHLEVLRWHLLRSVLAIVIFSIVVYIFSDFFVDDIIFGPTKPSFISVEWLCKMGQKVGIGDGLCFKPKAKFIETTLTGQFIASFTVAFVGGFILAFPYIFWEMWRFVKPALSEKEKKNTSGIIFWVSLLFFLGVAFGYFILTPLMVNFYFNYKLSAQIEILPTFSDYLENVVYTTLGIGLLFQTPFVVLILSKAGILTAAILKRYRRHALVVILIVAAIITPTTDPFSLMIVTIPLYILFEISVILAAKSEKKKRLDAPEEWS